MARRPGGVYDTVRTMAVDPKGAEALLQLRADYLSDGDELKTFWERRQETATGQREYTARKSGQKKEAGERQFDMAA